MNKQPILILALCFIMGIFFQDYFCLDKSYIYLLVVFCLIICISIFLKSYYLHRVRSFLIGGMFFGIGITLHFLNAFSSQNISVSKNETILFKISKKLNSTEKNKKYEAVAQVDKENFNTVVYVPKDSKDLDFKHYYKAEAFIAKPKSPQYDFQFDYSKYLNRKKIEYMCYINDKVSSAARKDESISEKFSQKRLEVLQNIDSTKMSSRSKEFLKGIILADRTEMDAETVKDFSRSGLIHFLAISGTHIVIIFELFYLLFIRISPLRFRKYAIVVSLLLIWLFAVFIGLGNSVVRSCLMLSVFHVYRLLQRKPDLLHSLALSAFIILIWDTQQIFDVGFQLSFLAVLGIFWLNDPILKYFPKQDNWFKKIIFNTISISVAAQLATLPLVFYYFHQFSFISILANFFIVPLSEAIIIFSFVMTGLLAFNINIDLTNSVYDVVIKILLKIIHYFAEVEVLYFEKIPMNLVEVFSVFVIVYTLRFTILKLSFRNIARSVMAVLCFLILRTGFDLFEEQKTEILVHDFNKDKVLSLKKGNKACFWIKENSDKDKITRFIINPYSSSRRISHIEIRVLPVSAHKVICNGRIYTIN